MSHASECTATSASQSLRAMPSRAKLTPRQGSGSSGGTSSAGSSTDQPPLRLPAERVSKICSTYSASHTATPFPQSGMSLQLYQHRESTAMQGGLAIRKLPGGLNKSH